MKSVARPVLLLGSEGMLGQSWRALLDSENIPYLAPTEAELDLTNLPAVEKFVGGRCRMVINCAAWTDVDGAETQSAVAELINGTAVGGLAALCAATDMLLVHYSTDYVFDGQADCPYSVDHPVCPVNAYGRSKLLGEQLVQESGCRYLLVRTSWLYAPWGKNFVRSIAGLAAERDVLTVVDDQRGRPTSAQHLARTTLGLIQRSATGIYHVTDGGDCTWFEFAREIARHTNANCRVEPCTTDKFPRSAKRPANSVLDLSLTEAALGVMPHWKDNLGRVMEALGSTVSGVPS